MNHRNCHDIARPDNPQKVGLSSQRTHARGIHIQGTRGIQEDIVPAKKHFDMSPAPIS